MNNDPFSTSKPSFNNNRTFADGTVMGYNPNRTPKYQRTAKRIAKAGRNPRLRYSSRSSYRPRSGRRI